MTHHQRHMASVSTWSPERKADWQRRRKEAQKRYNDAHRDRRRKHRLEYLARKKAAMTPEEHESERQRSAAYHKQYRAENAERRKAQKAAYYLTPVGIEKRRAGSERLHRRRGMLPRSKLPPEIALERARASWTKYRKTHAHVRRAGYARRYKTDVKYRLVMSLRKRVRDFLHGKTKSKKTLALLGCSLDELKIHLEKQFKPGMSWESYGKAGWHIDHIQACTLFDLSKPEQQAQCFRFTNLQPMWAVDNIRKGNKLPPGIPHPNPPQA